MAILDLLEFIDPTGEIIVAKLPHVGSDEFRLGSQLVVQQDQVAIFFRDGQNLDHFGPGRHTLTTQNLPLLGGVIGAAFGGKSPFRTYAIFVSTRVFGKLGWGTPNPILFRDTEFRMVNLRSHGMFSLRIFNPQLFVQTLVGSRGMETTYALEEFVRALIVSRLSEQLAGLMSSILDLPASYSKIAMRTREAVKDDLSAYGIELMDLVVEAITVPPEVQEMLNRATGVAAQDADRYRSIAISDALRSAGQNPGGGGEAMNLGLGLGIARSMAESLSAPSPAASPVPATNSLSMDEVRDKLSRLKMMVDEGLITPQDFEDQKRRLLTSL